MAMALANNGVNVQALLDAREALKGAPEATKFTWRASCKWQNGTYSKTDVKGFFGLGQEQSHKTETSFEADHPEIFAAEDRGITHRVRPRRPRELSTAGVAAVRRIAASAQLGGVEAGAGWTSAASSAWTIAQRLRRHQGDVHDRPTRPGRIRRCRPVAEARRSDVSPSGQRDRDRLTIWWAGVFRPGANAIERFDRRDQGPAMPASPPAASSPAMIDHVVLERGEVASAATGGTRCACSRRIGRAGFRVTPTTGQSDGYMTAGEVADLSPALPRSRARCARHTVTAVTPGGGGYHVATAPGGIDCRCVVIASGAAVARQRHRCTRRCRPRIRLRLPQPRPTPDGGVLVGPSATGLQLAAEIHRSGRPVTLLGGRARAPAAHLPRPRRPVG
jgi:hypothetical protein